MQQPGQSRQCTRGCTRLGAHGLCSALAKDPALGIVIEQMHQCEREFCQGDYPHGIARQEKVHDVAEIFRVISGHDCDTMYRA